MKTSKNILLVAVLLAVLVVLSGCAGQDGGAETKLIGWDENGPYVLKRKTNGSQVVIGKDVQKINNTFNETTKKKHQFSFVEKLAEGKKPVVNNSQDVKDVLTVMGF